jgi:glutamine cyclotransferase
MNNPKSSETNARESASNIPLISYSVTDYFPHDTTLFTGEFLFHNGELFESTEGRLSIKLFRLKVLPPDCGTVMV